MSSDRLKFVPFHSFVDSSFFQQLSDLKLNKYKLDTSSQELLAYYSVKTFARNQHPIVNLTGFSFDTSEDDFAKTLPKQSALFVPGYLNNVNTKEEFQRVNKNDFLNQAGQRIYSAFKSNEILENPSVLSSFSLLSFSDLKKFHFYYWFAFPSLYTEWLVNTNKPVSKDEQADLTTNVQAWLDNPAVKATKKNFFLLDALNNPLPLSEIVIDDKRNNSTRVGIIDSSTYGSSPAWYLRNYLTLLLYYGYTDIEVLVYRFNGTSFWLNVTASEKSINLNIKKNLPQVTGWEKTSNGTLHPKFADLQSLLSPTSLAEQAVDLNLKLMKWRIIPQIELDPIKDSKCLLLGAGTLGSYVARALLGWGVRNITFVDNGRVSFSNPVRQSLYTYEDCLDGGAIKATAAAESLQKIFPNVNAKGYNLEIPMIGHSVKDYVQEKKNYEILEKLIDEHDVIYLLMDSRETRWLPTVLGNIKHKIVLNAALGFDSYLVMRHGCLSPTSNLQNGYNEIENDHENENQKKTEDQNENNNIDNRLGCYFCNDVFAPSDSLTDRTLDQMCTVTRPGVALIASSLVVELMVSILQHPRRQYAEAVSSTATAKSDNTNSSSDNRNEKDDTILGELPHQIRGFLHNFNNIKLRAPNYKYCSACSIPVLQACKTNGWEFVVKALNDNKYVEELSGLTRVQQEAEKAALAFEEFGGAQGVGSDDGDSIDEEWL